MNVPRKGSVPSQKDTRQPAWSSCSQMFFGVVSLSVFLLRCTLLNCVCVLLLNLLRWLRSIRTDSSFLVMVTVLIALLVYHLMKFLFASVVHFGLPFNEVLICILRAFLFLYIYISSYKKCYLFMYTYLYVQNLVHPLKFTTKYSVYKCQKWLLIAKSLLCLISS